MAMEHTAKIMESTAQMDVHGKVAVAPKMSAHGQFQTMASGSCSLAYSLASVAVLFMILAKRESRKSKMKPQVSHAIAKVTS